MSILESHKDGRQSEWGRANQVDRRISVAIDCLCVRQVYLLHFHALSNFPPKMYCNQFSCIDFFDYFFRPLLHLLFFLHLSLSIVHHHHHHYRHATVIVCSFSSKFDSNAIRLQLYPLARPAKHFGGAHAIQTNQMMECGCAAIHSRGWWRIAIWKELVLLYEFKRKRKQNIELESSKWKSFDAQPRQGVVNREICPKLCIPCTL